MIGAFWNIRGLNKEGRLQCLAEFVNNNKLDFVDIQETKKENFTDSFLNYINKDFSWSVLPAKGTAGGVLVGLKSRKCEVLASMIGDYCVSIMVKNNANKFVWRLIWFMGPLMMKGNLLLFRNWNLS